MKVVTHHKWFEITEGAKLQEPQQIPSPYADDEEFTASTLDPEGYATPHEAYAALEKAWEYHSSCDCTYVLVPVVTLDSDY